MEIKVNITSREDGAKTLRELMRETYIDSLCVEQLINDQWVAVLKDGNTIVSLSGVGDTPKEAVADMVNLNALWTRENLKVGDFPELEG